MPTVFPLAIPHAPTGSVTQAALDTAFTIPLNDLAASAQLQDSGWLTFPLASGFTSTSAQYRLYAGQVFFRGTVTKTAGYATATQYVLGTVPSGFCPASQTSSTNTIVATGSSPPPSQNATGYVTFTGDVTIFTGASVPTAFVLSLRPYIAEQ